MTTAAEHLHELADHLQDLRAAVDAWAEVNGGALNRVQTAALRRELARLAPIKESR